MSLSLNDVMFSRVVQPLKDSLSNTNMNHKVYMEVYSLTKEPTPHKFYRFLLDANRIVKKLRRGDLPDGK